MTAQQPRDHSGSPPRQSAAAASEADERAARAHVDALLDEALADTFPASDPVALLVPAA
jgi:hypothetical protein